MNKSLKQFFSGMILVMFFVIFTQVFIFADNFVIYSDYIPENSVLWIWSDDNSASIGPFNDPSSPEGIYSYHTSHDAWAGWGIFSTSSFDLGEYSGGDLKFWVSTISDLRVEVEDNSGTSDSVYISRYGWDGSSNYQEITIPLNNFPNVDLTSIYSPFMITSEFSCDFYIDKVYWTIPITGYTPNDITIEGYQEIACPYPFFPQGQPRPADRKQHLYINGNEFHIKGINYTFIPAGYGPPFDWSLHPEYYEIDFPLISDMNTNVIRVHSPVTTVDSLDSAYNNNLHVIMSYYVDSSKILTEEGRNAVKNNFLEMVSHWKDHPAVLMWCIGNEVPNHLIWNGNETYIDEWFTLVGECAELVRNPAHAGEDYYDPYHPVTTANSDIGYDITGDGIFDFTIGDATYCTDDSSLTYLDAWGIQAYRGNSFGNLFTDYATKTEKPMIMLEYGCDRYDGRNAQEDETMQSDSIGSLFGEIYHAQIIANSRNRCLGACVFSWTDEWWKSDNALWTVQNTDTDWTSTGYIDNNINEEWFGVAGISDTDYTSRDLKESYYTLQFRFRRFESLLYRIRYFN